MKQKPTRWYRWKGDTLVLSLRVQTRANKDEFTAPHGGDQYKVCIKAPPVEGKANAHLIRFLAKSFGTTTSQVTIPCGANRRNKSVHIKRPSKLPLAVRRLHPPLQ